MSLSGTILQFIAVGMVFVAFTFAWSWYVGRKQGDQDIEQFDEAEQARGE